MDENLIEIEPGKKKKPNRKRPIEVRVRMTEDEYKIFQDKVKESGVTAQSFLLKCILDKPVFDISVIGATLGELRKEGNNLNQIARNMNTAKKIDNLQKMDTLIDLKKSQYKLQELWQSLKQLTSSLT